MWWRKKRGDLQKYRAARRRKTGPQELLAMFETLAIFRVSWKYTQNTSKINPCTVLVQEITNEDHNYSEHRYRNRSDSLPALTLAKVSVFSEACRFNSSQGPLEHRFSLKKMLTQMDWISSPSKSAPPIRRAWAKNWCRFWCSLWSDWELCSRRLQSALLRHSKILQ